MGQKGILIQLVPYKSETTQTEEGIIIPLYERYETDGGRPASRIKEDKLSTIGKVLQISAIAREVLDNDKIKLNIGDYVSISEQHKNSTNQFIIDKDIPVVMEQDFEGYLRIFPNMIESILINYEQN